MLDDDSDYLERAAILEIDGGLNRIHAEHRAALEIKLRAICKICRKTSKQKCSECLEYEKLKKEISNDKDNEKAV